VLHGNAGSALDRVYYAAALAPLGVEVLLLEYPGYGARPGEPSRPALTAAAIEALQALAAEGPGPVWLLGESLGSGVVARAAALRPGAASGLVLVTPYARLAEVARLHYPWLPSFLLRDRWDPLADLDGYLGPAAVLVAGRDEVVGAAQGRRLFDALRGPKLLSVQSAATHNGLDLDPAQPFWADAVALLSSGR
jgi:pimeloyl-ACP methyl ester carboxylesterase